MAAKRRPNTVRANWPETRPRTAENKDMMIEAHSVSLLIWGWSLGWEWD
jgi:hypothetical protein